ncbi:hypothetical protein [Streptomyces sp. DT203]|uniref:hypothetical protein n=1 Tax=Streptomyces sp. DT203 TaxID=3393424 RepID=UPI003CE7E7C1
MEQQILQATAERPLVGQNAPRTHDLVSWLAKAAAPKQLARALPVASAVALGVARARITMAPRTHGDAKLLQAKYTPHVDQGVAQLWHDLALLAATYDGLAAAGLRRRVEGHATTRPGVWARSLEWLLAAGRHLDGLDAALTMSLAERSGSVRTALRRSAHSTVLPVQQRAEGIEAVMHGSGPWQAGLLEKLSSTLDARRHVFPRPLDAPSSTWLASRDLEDRIRGAVVKAVDAFKSYVGDCGGLEEESLTATLLQHLVQHSTDAAALGRWAPPGEPQVEMASRQVSKKEEATTGADLGIVVDVKAPGSLAVRVGDLVQIKKAHALIPSKKTKRSAWTIDRDQLEHLLRHSATAVYWLILDDGDVLVVPAKYLAAIGNATIRQSPHLTVDRTSVRHAGVPLTHYLADLVTGLWLGSNDEAVLYAAEGRSHGQGPRHVLGITVTVPRLLDDNPRWAVDAH